MPGYAGQKNRGELYMRDQMVTTCLEKRFGHDPRLVFTVPLPEREPVFMKLNISEGGQDNCGLVIVDAAKFLALWRADPTELHKAEANGSPETWPSDYKYKDADDGFAPGRENPVPLAEVNLNHHIDTITSYKFWRFGKTVRKQRLDCIAFTNGITRTIWLLSHHCAAFPVQCDLNSAPELFKLAGAAGTSFHTIAEWAELAQPA